MTWPLVKLDSIKAPIRYSFVGGPFGSNLTTRDYIEIGIPVIRGVNLPDSSSFLDDDFVFVNDRKADQLLPNNAHPGDIIFTQRGTLGQVGLIPQEAKYSRYVISQSQMKLTVDSNKAFAPFVYYFFRLHATVEKIKAHTITSGVPHINLGMLKGFELPLPPVGTQQRIVSIMSAYDGMIAANQRRIQLLEEAARLLYREWFVKLRFPGHETVPVQDGVLMGWEKKSLGDYVTLNYGKGLKESDRVDGDVPVYGSSGIVGYHNKPLISGPAIIVGRKGNVGSLYYTHGPCFPIDTVYFISSEQTSYFLYLALQGFNFISSDAAVPGLNRSYAYSQQLLIPSPEVFTVFEATVQPIFEQTNALLMWNKKLRQARDLLLPKLMSGALEVSRITLPQEVAA